MLVLSRRPNQSIVIDGRITITVVRVRGNTVTLGIDAPREIPIHRNELCTTNINLPWSWNSGRLGRCEARQTEHD